MPAFHSEISTENHRQISNIPLLPFATKIRGPAPPLTTEQNDIISDAILLFRPNSFFKNFEISSPTDRLFIYCILFIQESIARISSKAPAGVVEAQKLLTSLALASFPIPGEVGFPLNAVCEKSSKSDADALRQYLSQLRQEIAIRLPLVMYDHEKPSKWWTCFAKRKFMGLNGVGSALF